MPELPEVETIRKTLEKLVLGKTIRDVSIYWSNIVQYPDDDNQFQMNLTGQTLQAIERRGKFLLFYFDEYVLVSHLRMEGKYRLVPTDEQMDKHTHVIFHFTDETDLRYNDVRKFGTMHLFPIGKEFDRRPLNQLGPDPFEATYTVDYMVGKMQKTSRNIKATLLDQTIIAGLGNIYVDEVLFLSQIHPETRANTLTEAQVGVLWENARIVLAEAVMQGGTTIRSYVDGHGEMGMFQQSLYVYGQTGEPCKKCATEIVKYKVAGRGTHICPSCQKRVG